MSEKCYSLNQEEFYGEPDELIQEFLNYCDPEIEFPYELELFEGDSIRKVFSDFVYPPVVIEDAQERAYEMSAEHSEGWLEELSEEQIKDLKASLDAWASRWDLHPKFFGVENVRPVYAIIENEDGDWKWKEEA